MSVPFVAQLRARPEVVRLGTSGEPVITVRVEVPEVWDTIRIDAPAQTSVEEVKRRALEVLVSSAAEPDRFVVKLGGSLVPDESVSLEAAGARNGSTFLVTGRRRRPVR